MTNHTQPTGDQPTGDQPTGDQPTGGQQLTDEQVADEAAAAAAPALADDPTSEVRESQYAPYDTERLRFFAGVFPTAAKAKAAAKKAGVDQVEIRQVY